MTGGSDAAAKSAPRPGRSRGFRLAVAVLIAGGLTLVVRTVPLADASVGELWRRMQVLRDEATAARRSPNQWASFAEKAQSELQAIADDARRAHDRRLGPWKWIAGIDRREEAALKEVRRIAESDLPALITSGPSGSPLRERMVDEGLARLDDHLAGASPYLPPLLPIENQAGLDRRPNASPIWKRWLVPIMLADLILLALGFAWWRSRKRRRSAA